MVSPERSKRFMIARSVPLDISTGDEKRTPTAETLTSPPVPEAASETSHTVFAAVHRYWSTLPESSRPRLYLYGLSLGSYGVESILGSIDLINEPIDGALLVGPPFVNPVHAGLVAIPHHPHAPQVARLRAVLGQCAL